MDAKMRNRTNIDTIEKQLACVAHDNRENER